MTRQYGLRFPTFLKSHSFPFFLVAYTLTLYVLITWINSPQVSSFTSSPSVRFTSAALSLPQEGFDWQGEKLPFHTLDCADVNRNADPFHTQAHLEFWKHIDNEALQQKRKEWQHFLETIPSYSRFAQRFSGYGIVFTSGNADTFERMLVTIKLLRHYGCKLPIEVWHLSDELSDKQRALLAPLHATARDLVDSRLIHPAAARTDNPEKNFQIKSAAIINSSFRHVIYIDSDNIPVRDPSYLFSTVEYNQTGALFWPDYWKTHKENAIFKVLDIGCINEWEQESGQVILDKARVWRALELSWFMQKDHAFYFQLLNGDKDTFKYAWLATGTPYVMPSRHVSPIGNYGPNPGDPSHSRYCGHSMLQYDFAGDPLFVHANLLKITERDVLGIWERPWEEVKRYTVDVGNRWLRPEFYVAPNGRPCVDLGTDPQQGDPEAYTTNFDDVVVGFQKQYFAMGGKSGKDSSIA